MNLGGGYSFAARLLLYQGELVYVRGGLNLIWPLGYFVVQ